MGLFKSFNRASQSDASNVDWKMLTSKSQLAELIEESLRFPILIFKHSTRCGISRMTLKRFEHEFDLQDKVTPYFLDLLQHRDVSDAISQQFNVVHQSPQVLLIKDGKSIYDASHERIDVDSLKLKI